MGTDYQEVASVEIQLASADHHNEVTLGRFSVCATCGLMDWDCGQINQVLSFSPHCPVPLMNTHQLCRPEWSFYLPPSFYT